MAAADAPPQAAGLDAFVDRSFASSAPLQPNEEVIVEADRLQGLGDPRGTLFALNLALDRAIEAKDAARINDIDKEMQAVARRASAELFAGAAPVLHFRRAVELRFRAGHVYGARLDLRHITKRARLAAVEILSLLLGAPALARLRRLQVRTRTEHEVDTCVALLRERSAPPLELLALSADPWPRAIVAPPQFGVDISVGLAERFPNLFLLGLADGIHPLAPASVPGASRRDLTAGDREVTAVELVREADPSTLPGRTAIGRALLSLDEALRAAALARVEEHPMLGEPLLPALAVLISPGVSRDPSAALRTLAALGPRAVGVLPRVARVVGAPRYFEVAARRQARLTLERLRASIAC